MSLTTGYFALDYVECLEAFLEARRELRLAEAAEKFLKTATDAIEAAEREQKDIKVLKDMATLAINRTRP